MLPALAGSLICRAFGLCSLTYSIHMTVAPSSVLSEFVGGSTSDVAMMIGVGLVKDSDAVFFQYLGEEQSPRALTIPTSGKPVYQFQRTPHWHRDCRRHR